MPLEEPSWWYGAGEDDLRIRMLRPAAHVYGWAATRRFAKVTAYTSTLPVICVGNFTAGGTGKTPLSILIARLLQGRGHRPAFLTRGYSGRKAGPAWVNATFDTAADVGDEPLLLASTAPTLVARDRAAGARAIEAAAAATHIIMDDGLQNPSLAKSVTLAVVDGGRGLGNGEVIPAGPLRAPIAFQFGLADAVIVNGGGDTPEILEQLRTAFPGPVLAAHIAPAAGERERFVNRSVIAYAGIGNPGRFITSLETLGAKIAGQRLFKDHHPFTDRDGRDLLDLAQRTDGQLVATQKDIARLAGAKGVLAELARQTMALRVEMVFSQADLARLETLVNPARMPDGG